MDVDSMTLLFILLGEAVGLIVLGSMKKRIENIDDRLERQDNPERGD